MKWYEYIFTIGGMAILLMSVVVMLVAANELKSYHPSYNGFIGVGFGLCHYAVAMAALISRHRNTGVHKK